MSSDPVQLGYATHVPWHRRKVTRRVIVAGFLLMLIGIGAFVGRDRISAAYYRKFLLNAQRKCLVHADPPDQIIYTDEPAEVAKRVGKQSGYDFRVVTSPAKYQYVALRVPEWEQFVGISGPTHGPALVTHGLTSQDGKRMLVSLQLILGRGGVDQLGFVAFMTTPRTFSGPDAPWYEYVIQVPVSPGGGGRPLRLYAAQFDPADESRFTIRYLSDGVEGYLDGRLESESTIAITVRDGPLKRVPE